MEKGFYIGTVGSKAVYVNPSKPCTIIDPKGVTIYGELGRASKLRSFHKDEFILNLVPGCDFLKREGERIRVWHPCGGREASEYEIKTMILQGWKKRTDADISKYIAAE